MTATRTPTTSTTSTTTSSVPAHRRARDWHGAAQRSVANPRRSRAAG